MKIIDKRLEFLEALVIATKQVNEEFLNDELDFVEYYNIPYVKELINKINISKYPEVVDYINDIRDCSYYTNLFLFFDENFDLKGKPHFEVFKHKKIEEFAKIIRTIYEKEKINEVFVKYNDYLNVIERSFENKYKIDFKERLNELYGTISEVTFYLNISLLINGGFSSIKDNKVSYVKGIKVNKNMEDVMFNEYTIVCLFHEYSHYFVNDIIDRCFDKINNLDILYSESINNNLPITYQNEKTLLYEYFTRANSMILSENLISKQEYAEDIKWIEEIGFVRIKEIIEIIKIGLKKHLKFEDIFKNLVIDYFNNISKKIKR